VAVERCAAPTDEAGGASSAVRPFVPASWAIASLSAMTFGSDTGRPKPVPFCLALIRDSATLMKLTTDQSNSRYESGCHGYPEFSIPG
jgi:hypothetical protein